VALMAMVVATAGCAPPGTPAPLAQAAKVGVATSDIATACGYAEEASAFGWRRVNLSPLEAMARHGAVKLARVYEKDQSDIYQGETIAQVVGGAIALLGQCGLPEARGPLLRASAAVRRANARAA
jgi:hypothetical protein